MYDMQALHARDIPMFREHISSYCVMDIARFLVEISDTYLHYFWKYEGLKNAYAL